MADSSTKKIIELIGNLQKTLDEHTAKFTSIEQTLESHTTKFTTIEQTLESHTASLVEIESTNKVYGDMYKINNDNVRKIQSRIEVLENRHGIEPSPEHILLDVA